MSTSGGTSSGSTATDSLAAARRPVRPLTTVRAHPGGARAVPADGQRQEQCAEHPSGVEQGGHGVAGGEEQVAEVGEEPAADTDRERDPQVRAPATAHEDPQHQRQQDGVGHRVRRPDRPHRRGGGVVTHDRLDGQGPQQQEADGHDREGVDEGVDTGLRLAAHDGDQHQRGRQQQVARQVPQVGHRRVGLPTAPVDDQPRQVAQRGGRYPRGDQSRDEPTLARHPGRGPPGQDGRQNHAGEVGRVAQQGHGGDEVHRHQRQDDSGHQRLGARQHRKARAGPGAGPRAAVPGVWHEGSPRGCRGRVATP